MRFPKLNKMKFIALILASLLLCNALPIQANNANPTLNVQLQPKSQPFSLDRIFVDKPVEFAGNPGLNTLAVQSRISVQAVGVNELTFDIAGSPYTQAQKDALTEFLLGSARYPVGMYKCIKDVFGAPLVNETIKFDIVPPGGAPNYNPGTKTISLQLGHIDVRPELLFHQLETVTHEVIHAFSDAYILRFQNLEEGFTSAQSVLAAKLFCDRNGIPYLLAASFPGMPYGLNEYDLINCEAISPPNGELWTEVISVRIKYMMSSIAIWKIWRETSPDIIKDSDPRTYSDSTFFKVFHRKLIDTILASGLGIDAITNNFEVLKRIIREALIKCTGSDIVESQPIFKWWSKQHILSYETKTGLFLFCYNPYFFGSPIFDSSSVCHLRYLNLFVRQSDGLEWPVTGDLFIDVYSLHSQKDYSFDDNVSEKVTATFSMKPGGPMVLSNIMPIFTFPIYPPIPIPPTLPTVPPVANYDGELFFNNLPKGGYKIDLTAITSTGKTTLTLYYGNKLDTITPNVSYCFGVISKIFIPGDVLECRSLTRNVVTPIPLDINGVYFVQMRDGEKLEFHYYNRNIPGLDMYIGQNVSREYNVFNIIITNQISGIKLKQPDELNQRNPDGSTINWSGSASGDTVLLYSRTKENFSMIEFEVEYEDPHTFNTIRMRFYNIGILLAGDTGIARLSPLAFGKYRWKSRVINPQDGRKSEWSYPMGKSFQEAHFSVNKPSDVGRIEIWPGPSITVQKGSVNYFIAKAFDRSGNIMQNITFDWSSTCGTISNNGVYIAPTNSAYCVVTAKANGLSASAIVNILSNDIHTIEINPTNVVLQFGSSMQFNARAFDIYGYEVPNVQFEWIFEPSALGSLYQNGLFIADKLRGTGLLKVRAGGKEKVTLVTVQ